MAKVKTKRASNTKMTQRDKAILREKRKQNGRAFRLEKQKSKDMRFKEKQKTKRLSQVPESIKALGQAVAYGSTPIATSAASNRASQSAAADMAQLINPTGVASTSNQEEEDDTLKGGFKVR